MGGKTSKPASTKAPPPPPPIVTLKILNKTNTNAIKKAISNYNLKQKTQINAEKQIQQSAPRTADNIRRGNTGYNKEKYIQAQQKAKQASTALINAETALYAAITSSTRKPNNSAYYSMYLNRQFGTGTTLMLTKQFLKDKGYKLNNNV